jgi:peptidoglycan/LPS O-acetylase OafA/YrhL
LRPEERKFHPLLPLAAGLIALALNTNHVPDPVKYSVGAFFLAVAIATVGSAPAFVIRILSSRVLLFFGAISFSLYLWQQPFVTLIPGPAFARVFAALFIAMASFYLIERPARRLLNRLGSARTLQRSAI